MRCRLGLRRSHFPFSFVGENDDAVKTRESLLSSPRSHRRKSNLLTIHQQHTVQIPKLEMDPALAAARLTTTGTLPSTMTRFPRPELSPVPNITTTTSTISNSLNPISNTKKSSVMLRKCPKKPVHTKYPIEYTQPSI